MIILFENIFVKLSYKFKFSYSSIMLTHAERDDVHGAASHATRKQRLDLLVELSGRDPVSQSSLDALRGVGNGGDLLRSGDERARFDAGDVLRIGSSQEAIVVLRQRDEHAGIDELKEHNAVSYRLRPSLS